MDSAILIYSPYICIELKQQPLKTIIMQTVMTPKTIREFITENSKMTNEEISLHLGIDKLKVRGNRARLNREANELVNGSKPKTVKNLKIEPKFLGQFLNENGEKKENARDIMVNAIDRSKYSNKTILTLSAGKCIIERQLLELGSRRKFLACEKFTTVYHELLTTIVKFKLPISTYNGFVGDVIEKSQSDEFSHIILDYCCQLGKVENDIKLAMQKNIVEVGGTISITLNKRISGNWDLYKKLETLNPPKNFNEETRTEHALITFINRYGGFGYAIESIFNYHDTSSMILVVVRRIE